MFPVATAGGGTCKAFPDTCKTPVPGAPPPPPVPIPYPNLAMLLQANRATCSLKVKAFMQPVVTMKTMVPMSSGDEAGSVGGVQSGMIKGPVRPVKGSAKVMVEGVPAVFHTCPFGQNGAAANAPAGIHDTPSQTKVMVSM